MEKGTLYYNRTSVCYAEFMYGMVTMNFVASAFQMKRSPLDPSDDLLHGGTPIQSPYPPLVSRLENGLQS